MKKIALTLILAVIISSGIACSGNGNVEPTQTPTPTPTPNTPEVTVSEPEKTAIKAANAFNDNDAYSLAECYPPDKYDMITSRPHQEFMKTLTIHNFQTSLLSISGNSATVRTEQDTQKSDGTIEHEVSIVGLEKIDNKWIITSGERVN